MKHFKLFAAVVVFALIFSFSNAQEKTELENSVLWKVEHKELEKPSYILGTLHLMCEEDFKIPEKVNQALQNVDALVLEINLSDPTEMQAIQEAMTNATKISEELSQEQYNELDKLVKKITEMPLSAYDAYGLSILNSILISKMLPCSQLKYHEIELASLATKSQKPIYSLEKASQQMEMMEKAFPAEFAFKQMMQFESYKKDFTRAIAAYNNEDISEAVGLLTKDDYMDENSTLVMQINRNKNWVEKMPVMMSERSNLFAVGAAHLTEDYGIINLLKERGYTVTPVYN
ncbi:TraB/GumN family protein [Salinimicrobium terrae]|uniref:TraB/GumN family protein n=1 Tax=Salinimicrobium terrae TaxID=470866 RepID=UPI0003F82F2D|nr:TraB/GumN family protein [Salinimicrobium terrae]